MLNPIKLAHLAITKLCDDDNFDDTGSVTDSLCAVPEDRTTMHHELHELQEYEEVQTIFTVHIPGHSPPLVCEPRDVPPLPNYTSSFYPCASSVRPCGPRQQENSLVAAFLNVF